MQLENIVELSGTEAPHQVRNRSSRLEHKYSWEQNCSKLSSWC